MIKVSCKNPLYVNGVVAPCGKCFSCRSKYRRQWQLRMQHELLTYNYNAMFLTLTYNDENLPTNHSLSKRDVQLFIKRLRKFYKDVPIRYFAVGEYGDRKLRPHYHLIIYGLKAPEQRRKSKLNWKYGKFLSENIWKKGFTFVGYVDSKCISYVSKYVLKSFVKDISNEDFIKGGMEPVFSLKSSGLGLTWLLNNVTTVVNDLKQGKTVKLFKGRTSYPRYYRKKLIEMGHFDENFFRDRYYKEMDSLQSSILQELSDVHINLGPSNYLNISISELFTIDKQKKFIDKEVKVSLPGRYDNDKIINTHVEVPKYSFDEINDILENHWFIIYKRYVSSCHDIELRKFRSKNKDWYSEYE